MSDQGKQDNYYESYETMREQILAFNLRNNILHNKMTKFKYLATKLLDALKEEHGPRGRTPGVIGGVGCCDWGGTCDVGKLIKSATLELRDIDSKGQANFESVKEEIVTGQVENKKSDTEIEMSVRTRSVQTEQEYALLHIIDMLREAYNKQAMELTAAQRDRDLLQTMDHCIKEVKGQVTAFLVARGRLSDNQCDKKEKVEQKVMEEPKEIPPVDRSARVLANSGEPVKSNDHREIITKGQYQGQQKDYVVLSPAERARGFVRPVRRTYIHKPCDTVTTISSSIAETYARDPGFYGATFCVRCRNHFPLAQFVWVDTDQIVGS